MISTLTTRIGFEIPREKEAAEEFWKNLPDSGEWIVTTTTGMIVFVKEQNIISELMNEEVEK